MIKSISCLHICNVFVYCHRKQGYIFLGIIKDNAVTIQDSADIVPHILNLDTRWQSAVTCTSQLLKLWITSGKETECCQNQCGCCAEKTNFLPLPVIQPQFFSHPACSQILIPTKISQVRTMIAGSEVSRVTALNAMDTKIKHFSTLVTRM